MIEFESYRSNPAAPTVYVNKVGGIYRIDTTIIKATFITGSPGPGGKTEYIEGANLLWEANRWMEAGEVMRWVMAQFSAGTFHNAMPDDGGGKRPRTQ